MQLRKRDICSRLDSILGGFSKTLKQLEQLNQEADIAVVSASKEVLDANIRKQDAIVVSEKINKITANFSKLLGESE